MVKRTLKRFLDGIWIGISKTLEWVLKVLKWILKILRKITWKGFMDTLTILSFILTVGSIALAIHVYFRDVRPVIEDAELYERIETLKKNEKKLVTDMKNTQEKLTAEIEIKERKAASLDKKLAETNVKAVALQNEIINVYKAFYLETVSLELENESAVAVLTQDDSKMDVKSRALELLREKEVKGEYQIKALDDAIEFVEESIRPDSGYYELRFYEIDAAIKELQKTIEKIESSINKASESMLLKN